MSLVTAVRPISEQIANALFDRLQLLAAQYSVYTPVSEVIRPTRMGGYTPKHLQVVLTQNDPEVNEELGCPGNPPATAYNILFNIRCHVMPSERDTTVVDEIINTFDADVVRAVADQTIYGAMWYTLGDLATDAAFQTRESIEADGSFVGFNLPLLVTYRTDENNPYNGRA